MVDILKREVLFDGQRCQVVLCCSLESEKFSLMGRGAKLFYVVLFREKSSLWCREQSLRGKKSMCYLFTEETSLWCREQSLRGKKSVVSL